MISFFIAKLDISPWTYLLGLNVILVSLFSIVFNFSPSIF
jgi:hypothetical protein